MPTTASTPPRQPPPDSYLELSCACLLPGYHAQVKAFRFMGCAPRRPFRLTARAKDDAKRRLRGELPPAGAAAGAGRPSSNASGGRKHAKSRSTSSLGMGRRDAGSSRQGGKRSDDSDGGGMDTPELPDTREGGLEGGLGGLRGDWEVAQEAAVAAAAVGGGQQCERKQLACGMCGAMRVPEDVSFRMTAKMVRETLFHVSFVGTGSSLHSETPLRQKHAVQDGLRCLPARGKTHSRCRSIVQSPGRLNESTRTYAGGISLSKD